MRSLEGLTPRAIGRQFALPALGLLLSQLLSFAAMWLVSRALGAESYGRLGLAMIAAVYAAMLVQWGVDPLLTRELARGDESSARRTLAAFLRQRHFSSVAAILAGAVLALLWPYPDEKIMLWLGAIDGVLLAYSTAGAFDARARMSLYFLINALRQSFYLGAVLLVLHFAPQFVSPLTILLMHLCGVLLQVGLEWTWVRAAFGLPDWADAGTAAKKLWRDATPLALGACALQALLVSGPVALEFSGHRSELGWLVLSNQLITVASSFLSIPSRQIHAQLSLQPPDGETFKRLVWQQVFRWSVFGFAAAFVLAVFAPWLVNALFSADFAPAGALLSIEAWRLPGLLATAVLSSALICLRRERACALCHLAALLCTAGLLVWRVPHEGAAGAAQAVVVGRYAFPIVAAAAFIMIKNSEPQP